MNKKLQRLTFVGVAAIGLAAGIGIQYLRAPAPVVYPMHTGTEATTPDKRPDFTLLDLQGKARSAKEWDGKVLMVNFWAAWCPPCRREIPAFIKLKQTYGAKGLEIVGIALDSKANVTDFLDPLDINYPVLLGDKDGIALAKAYGDRLGILPFTIIIDRSGKIVNTHRSEFTFDEVKTIIEPLL